MNLPANYFWIPGYADRYAMFYDDALGHLTDVVYSVNYGGCKGTPIAIDSRGNGNYYLSKDGLKSGWHIISLKKQVELSRDYQQFIHEKDNATKAKGTVTWIIGGIANDGRLAMNPIPHHHETEAAAYAEAERLANLTPGKTFIVFKAVRKVVAGGISVTDF